MATVVKEKVSASKAYVSAGKGSGRAGLQPFIEGEDRCEFAFLPHLREIFRQGLEG